MALNVTPFVGTDNFNMETFNNMISQINSGVNSEISGVLAQLGTKAKIQTGSYIGTGTYGDSNPNTLTFDSPPKLVLIHANSSDATILSSTAFIYGSALGSSFEDDSVSELHLIWSGNTLSWYHYGGGLITGEKWQLNARGVKYYYAAVL